ncbi:hypothetical protein TrLO_g15532 [Triparma laevis f. longispina]|uniref:Uncharacterized protein n=1 Tax=Triparma laevis f. longispina TaxID=1714387 RepID=A0A9W7KTX1_9STRA|nr:hypothetical protein TrLO_g15532 [Triparma laevis f. longispina]
MSKKVTKKIGTVVENSCEKYSFENLFKLIQFLNRLQDPKTDPVDENNVVIPNQPKVADLADRLKIFSYPSKKDNFAKFVFVSLVERCLTVLRSPKDQFVGRDFLYKWPAETSAKTYYPGFISSQNQDGTYVFNYDDGEIGEVRNCEERNDELGMRQ